MKLDNGVLEIDLSDTHVVLPPVLCVEQAEFLVAHDCRVVQSHLYAALTDVLVNGKDCHTVRVRTSIAGNLGFLSGSRFTPLHKHHELRSFGSWSLTAAEAARASAFWINPSSMRETVLTKLEWMSTECRSNVPLVANIYWTAWTHFLNLDSLI